MRALRIVLGSLLWILAGLLLLLGVLLSVTIILLPLGVPLFLLGRKLMGVAVALFVPREVRHPLQEAKKSLKSDAGSRDVAIPPHLVPLVKDHLKNLTAPGRDALLFPAAADDNLRMAPSTLYKVYHPARKAAGREDLRWHDLRHTGVAEIAKRISELAGGVRSGRPWRTWPPRSVSEVSRAKREGLPRESAMSCHG